MSDAAYMDAVRRGDMKTAQRMVDASLLSPEQIFALEQYGRFADLYKKGETEYDGVDIDQCLSAAWSDMTRSGLSESEANKVSGTDNYRDATDLIFRMRKVNSEPVVYDSKGNVIPLSQRFGLRNPRQSMMGININDKVQDYTGQILRGDKTIETRPSRSLDSRIGKRTGIIRTGAGNATLVGYAIIGKPVVYDSVAKFRRDQSKHRVAPGSVHDIKGGLKYGYPLMQVESVTPRVITSRGNVIRKLNPVKKNPATPEDFPYVGGSRMRASPQTKTEAFKKWFAGSIVVNQDGSPRVMYHGTGWTGISKFESYRARGGISGFFAFDPEFASDFAMVFGPEEYNADEDEGEAKKYATVYPVYLSLKKVFDVRKKSDRDDIEFNEEPRGKGWDWTQLENYVYVRKMKSKGYDGFIDFEAGSNYPPTGIAVFDPRNVKSATGNRGTFDPADPDIRNPRRSMIRTKLSRIIEPGDRVLDYDRAQGEDLYRLWDLIHTDMPLNAEALTEIEGMLDDDGVLVIQSGEEPAGLRDHFRRATRYQGMLLVQGPMNPEEARINTEKLRRDLE